jgi:hypothetical protein
VHDNWVKTDMVEERECRCERFEVFGDNGPADLDDGELLRGNRAEMRKVLLDFSLGANIAE